MEVERKRPIKMFRVLKAYGAYVKGSLIQPTGMYRDMLLRRGLIEEVKDPEPDRALHSPTDRMVRLPEKTEGRPILTLRKRDHVR